MPLTDSDLFEAVRRTIARGDEVVIAVRGRSMMPSLRPDVDEVILSPAVVPLRRGDIVLARVEGSRHVLHRVIAVHRDGSLTLMGDGNLHQRELCLRGDVVGVVTAVVRPDGRLRAPGRARLWRLLCPLRPLIVKLFPSLR